MTTAPGVPGMGIALSPGATDLAPGRWRALVDHAVAAGFDSIWSLDNPLADQAEPLVWLATVAATYPGVGVGTAAVVAPVREPILLAKQLATLDRLTGGGRLTVGLTIGRRPADHALIGTDYHHRGAVLADVVAVLKACWSGASVEVTGSSRTWQSEGPVGVLPATTGGPPVLLGGLAPTALDRAVSLADGYVGSATGGPAAALDALGQVHTLLEKHGRERSTFQCVTNVFVVVARDRAKAVALAAERLAGRHGGSVHFDPDEVVVGGSAAEVADHLHELHAAGYERITVVPVLAEQPQIDALGEVVAAVRSRG